MVQHQDPASRFRKQTTNIAHTTELLSVANRSIKAHSTSCNATGTAEQNRSKVLTFLHIVVYCDQKRYKILLPVHLPVVPIILMMVLSFQPEPLGAKIAKVDFLNMLYRCLPPNFYEGAAWVAINSQDLSHELAVHDKPMSSLFF